jgi:hypothetical protein
MSNGNLNWRFHHNYLFIRSAVSNFLMGDGLAEEGKGAGGGIPPLPLGVRGLAPENFFENQL